MSLKVDLHDQRKNYDRHILTEENASANPFEQFALWYKEVGEEKQIIEPNVMVLATASVQAKPTARVVLLKEFSEKGFVFYTNYSSKKGKELAQNPQASALFFWDVLERQVRIEGVVKKVDAAMSEIYFNSRPIESRMGAIASPQSEVIPNREIIEAKIKELESTGNVARPQHWGGFILIPDYFEFWQGRPNRVHDRLAYSKQEHNWIRERLAP